jgi:hypothetical protein
MSKSDKTLIVVVILVVFFLRCLMR